MEEKKEKNKYRTHGISWANKSLLANAKKRAFNANLSLSQYINLLVERDLEKGGPIVIPERADPDSPTKDKPQTPAQPPAQPPKSKIRIPKRHRH